MPTLFDPRVRASILDRIARLTPDRKPVWGRFMAPEMVCHLTSFLRQGMGELDSDPPSSRFAWFPMNWIVIHVLPWPKGKGTSPPEFLATRPTTWETDIGRLRELVERSSSKGPAGPWPASFAFGRISGRSWGVLEYKHLDHHLRQFGV